MPVPPLPNQQVSLPLNLEGVFAVNGFLMAEDGVGKLVGDRSVDGLLLLTFKCRGQVEEGMPHVLPTSRTEQHLHLPMCMG